MDTRASKAIDTFQNLREKAELGDLEAQYQLAFLILHANSDFPSTPNYEFKTETASYTLKPEHANILDLFKHPEVRALFKKFYCNPEKKEVAIKILANYHTSNKYTAMNHAFFLGVLLLIEGIDHDEYLNHAAKVLRAIIGNSDPEIYAPLIDYYLDKKDALTAHTVFKQALGAGHEHSKQLLAVMRKLAADETLKTGTYSESQVSRAKKFLADQYINSLIKYEVAEEHLQKALLQQEKMKIKFHLVRALNLIIDAANQGQIQAAMVLSYLLQPDFNFDMGFEKEKQHAKQLLKHPSVTAELKKRFGDNKPFNDLIQKMLATNIKAVGFKEVNVSEVKDAGNDKSKLNDKGEKEFAIAKDIASNPPVIKDRKEDAYLLLMMAVEKNHVEAKYSFGLCNLNRPAMAFKLIVEAAVDGFAPAQRFIAAMGAKIKDCNAAIEAEIADYVAELLTSADVISLYNSMDMEYFKKVGMEDGTNYVKENILLTRETIISNWLEQLVEAKNHSLVFSECAQVFRAQCLVLKMTPPDTAFFRMVLSCESKAAIAQPMQYAIEQLKHGLRKQYEKMFKELEYLKGTDLFKLKADALSKEYKSAKEFIDKVAIAFSKQKVVQQPLEAKNKVDIFKKIRNEAEQGNMDSQYVLAILILRANKDFSPIGQPELAESKVVEDLLTDPHVRTLLKTVYVNSHSTKIATEMLVNRKNKNQAAVQKAVTLGALLLLNDQSSEDNFANTDATMRKILTKYGPDVYLPLADMILTLDGPCGNPHLAYSIFKYAAQEHNDLACQRLVAFVRHKVCEEKLQNPPSLTAIDNKRVEGLLASKQVVTLVRQETAQEAYKKAREILETPKAQLTALQKKLIMFNLEKAAKLGNAFAQVILGMRYLAADVCPKDERCAFKWILSAFYLKNPAAIAILSGCWATLRKSIGPGKESYSARLLANPLVLKELQEMISTSEKEAAVQEIILSAAAQQINQQVEVQAPVAQKPQPEFKVPLKEQKAEPRPAVKTQQELEAQAAKEKKQVACLASATGFFAHEDESEQQILFRYMAGTKEHKTEFDPLHVIKEIAQSVYNKEEKELSCVLELKFPPAAIAKGKVNPEFWTVLCESFMAGKGRDLFDKLREAKLVTPIFGINNDTELNFIAHRLQQYDEQLLKGERKKLVSQAAQRAVFALILQNRINPKLDEDAQICGIIKNNQFPATLVKKLIWAEIDDDSPGPNAEFIELIARERKYKLDFLASLDLKQKLGMRV